MTSARWPHQASGCCQQKWRIIPALRQLLHYKSWTRGEGHVPMAYPCALPKEVILGKGFLRRHNCSFQLHANHHHKQNEKAEKSVQVFFGRQVPWSFLGWGGDHKSLYAKYGCWVLDIQRWQRCKTLVPDFKEIMVYSGKCTSNQINLITIIHGIMSPALADRFFATSAWEA